MRDFGLLEPQGAEARASNNFGNGSNVLLVPQDNNKKMKKLEVADLKNVVLDTFSRDKLNKLLQKNWQPFAKNVANSRVQSTPQLYNEN